MSKLDLSLLSIAALLILFVLAKMGLSQHRTSSVASEIDISDLIEKLSQELRRSEERRVSNGEASLFQLSEAEIDVNFALKQRTNSEGTVTVSAVAVKVGDEFARETTHNLKIKLAAVKPRTGESPPDEGESK
jgi:hypothetical protein